MCGILLVTDGEVSVIKNIKQKILPSLLCGLAVGFTYIFFGAADTFAGNRKEFLFSFSDFGGYLALIAAVISLLITLLLLIADGTLFRVLFGIFFWIAFMGYLQGMFLNVGMGSLAKDDVGTKISTGFLIFDTALWIITAGLCILGALKMKKHETIKTIAIVLLVMIVGMQTVGCVSNIPKLTDRPAQTTATTKNGSSSGAETTSIETTVETKDEDVRKYLTEMGINEVSGGKNIIVFVLDRFDISYYNDVVSDDPEFFSKLTGFTFFDDNISLFSRTYPGVATMITGLPYMYDRSAESWLDNAYGTSPFLADLKENGYKVKLYTSDYYGYRDANSMKGTVENISSVTKYTVNDRAGLVGNMMALSLYRCLPSVLKSSVSVSSSSFDRAVSYNGEAPAYKIDDPRLHELLGDGLSADDSKGSYIFIHMNGCHQPYDMDEDGNRVENGAALPAIRGDFKMIYSYIDEMRRLGVYEDSTIVITGDHPSARDDGEIPTQPRITSLFVKQSGRSDEPLEYSHAQVCQDNLIATLVKSAGIETENDYGKSYFDIDENENVTRHHIFELYDAGKTRLIDFAVTGKGSDFSNWKAVSDINIGSLYN